MSLMNEQQRQITLETPNTTIWADFINPEDYYNGLPR